MPSLVFSTTKILTDAQLPREFGSFFIIQLVRRLPKMLLAIDDHQSAWHLPTGNEKTKHY
jgi:hypothetical protein